MGEDMEQAKVCIENLGTRQFKWVDLDNAQEAIDSILESNNEFEIVDIDNVPAYQAVIRYHSTVEELQLIMELADEHGFDCVEAAINLFDGELCDLGDFIQDSYHGAYDSEIDFAEQYIDDCVAHEIPEHLRYYFDVERYARDLFMDGYQSDVVNGQTHVFSSY